VPVAPPARRSAFQIFVLIQSLLPERVWHCSFGAASVSPRSLLDHSSAVWTCCTLRL